MGHVTKRTAQAPVSSVEVQEARREPEVFPRNHADECCSPMVQAAILSFIIL